MLCNYSIYCTFVHLLVPYNSHPVVNCFHVILCSDNPDGTVDLVFNVPRGGEALLRLNNFQMNTTMVASGRTGTTENPDSTSRPLKARSQYPISIDTDYVINSPNVCPAGQPVDYLIIVHR